MQIVTTNSVYMNDLVKERENTRNDKRMPKNCVPFSQFKKEFFKRLKKRYEEIQVDHS